jgi:hypothetical protein
MPDRRKEAPGLEPARRLLGEMAAGIRSRVGPTDEPMLIFEADRRTKEDAGFVHDRRDS